MARGGKAATGKRAGPTAAPRTLILDNGAHTIKAGFSTEAPSPDDCHIIPNCIAHSQRDRKTYVGAELADCRDFGELALRRPVEKGFVANWAGEKAIWEASFDRAAGVVACDPAETRLILTEAPNAPAVLQRNADEMVFEEFEFASALRIDAPVLNAYAPSPFPDNAEAELGVPMECLLLVDIGYSHSTITPLYQGRPLHIACRRLEVGGKTLTNALKESLSRTVEVQKEDWIVQEIKEDVCYVSREFVSDLERAWKGGLQDPRPIDPSIVVDYVLPDYDEIKRGFARPHDTKMSRKERALGAEGGRREHIITIANERFTIPELLFTPSDIGMQQEGLAGTILQSIYSLPPELWQAFLANILIVGGTSKLPGLLSRLDDDLRSRVADDYVVRIAQAADPTKNAWLGGARLAQNEPVVKSLMVTREEYLEHGHVWTRRKLSGKIG